MNTRTDVITSEGTAKTPSQYFGFDPTWNSGFSRFSGPLFLHEKDENGGGGNEEKEEVEKSETDSEKEKSGDEKKETEPKKEFSQSDMDSLAGRVRAEEKAKFEKAEKERKEKAEKEEKSKQGKFEELYSELQKREESEYKPAVERLEKLATRVNAMIDSEIKSWPSEVKELDPGTDDIEKRSTWLEKTRPLAKRLLDSEQAIDHEHGKNGKDKSKGSVSKNYIQSRYSRPKKD